MESGNHVVYSSRMYADKSYTSFKWCLEDYSILHKSYNDVNSPPFKICQTDDFCMMQFDAKFDPAMATACIPAYIKLHTVKVEVSIVDECDRKIITKSDIKTGPLKSKDETGFAHFYYDLINSSELLTKKKYLPNDTLRLLCEITIIKNVNQSSIDTVTQGRCLDNKVRDKFEEFYKDEKFFDITLCVDGTKFRAHKIILAATSPVFEAMFKISMSEQADNEVKISDIDPADFEAFLKAVYSGIIDSVEDHVAAILIIADKYQVTTIKHLCEKFIKNNLNSNNVIEYLLLAHSHGFNDLKKHALAVALNLREELGKSLNCKELCDYPELVSEIFQKVTECGTTLETSQKTTS